LRAWREFQQADMASALAVEEAIALLCDATRRAAPAVSSSLTSGSTAAWPISTRT
jgi:hypothetical protein